MTIKNLFLVMMLTALAIAGCSDDPADDNGDTNTDTADASDEDGQTSDNSDGSDDTSAAPDDSEDTQANPGDDGDTGALPSDGSELTSGACTVGAGNQSGSGRTQQQYLGADVQRDGKNYKMITNGWGQNWVSHDISWEGTSMTVHTYEGSRQDNGAPAGYPTVFCGRYSDTSQDCGLPRPVSDISSIHTAVDWSHQAGDGTYNVAYDVWLGNGSSGFGGLESYFMVWLRDPPGEQPAGSIERRGAEVDNVPGQWDIIAGTVNNLPIVNYVRTEGIDTHAIAFDIMDLIRDAQSRGLDLPGNDLLAVAIGFEVWSGPVTELSLNDFCLDIQ